jgi:hypothetical protein
MYNDAVDLDVADTAGPGGSENIDAGSPNRGLGLTCGFNGVTVAD